MSNPKPDVHNINAHTKSCETYWYLLQLSSGNDNMDVSRGQITCQNLPISNPKPDLHNMNARTKFDLNPLTFTQVIVQETSGRTDGHASNQRDTKIPHHYRIGGIKTDEICPLTIQTTQLRDIHVYAKFE